MAPTLDQFPLYAAAGSEDSRNAPAGRQAAASAAQAASDEELLIAVSNAHDIQAFNTLFRRFSGKIFALGMKLTRNEQLSRDLVQEAMLTVWQKAPLFDLDKGSAQNWIFTLTRNRCFDALRKLKRQPQTVSADDVFGPGYEFEGAETVSGDEFRNVELAEIEDLMPQLPAPQQEVIRQIYMLDLTHEEAAQELNIPLGTLKSRLRLGMARLKQLIGEME